MSGERVPEDLWVQTIRTRRLAEARCECGGSVACRACGEAAARLIECRTIVASPSRWSGSDESRDPTWDVMERDGVVVAEQVRG